MTTTPFFSFTAQGLMTLAAIVAIGLKVLNILRKFDQNVASWLWEHEVMWNHHKAHHEVPIFPNLILEKRGR